MLFVRGACELVGIVGFFAVEAERKGKGKGKGAAWEEAKPGFGLQGGRGL